MKLTQILQAHHRGRWRSSQWRLKGWQVKRVSYAKKTLEEHNIPYENGLEFVKDPKPVVSFDYINVFNPPTPKKNEHHPDFKSIPCFSYGDNNVLVEGLNQAKVLTNTVEVEENLPQMILKLKEETSLPSTVHKIVQKTLYSALVFDAYQEKLPLRYLEGRPTHRLPRDYGITDIRKNYLIGNKLLQLCESLSNVDISSRAMLNDARFQLSVQKDEDLVQFQLSGDKVVMGDVPLPSFLDNHQSASSIDLPNIHPLKSTISMEKTHFYNTDDYYPLHPNASHPYLHTALIHYNDTQVKNSFATPVTDSQVLARSLLKAFVMTAAQARYLYGNDVKDLPSPCTVQLVQTDAKMFHFCTFQLNTLDLSSTQKVRNIFWSHPVMEISSDWGYHLGKPGLTGYNPHVFEMLYAFYRNAGARKEKDEKPQAIQASA